MDENVKHRKEIDQNPKPPLKLKTMYKTPIMHDGLLNVADTTEGESIENKVTRIIANKEPIKDGVPLIYTERKDGVNAAYNIRTDRWEIATDAMDKITKIKAAKNEELAANTGEEIGKTKPVQETT